MNPTRTVNDPETHAKPARFTFDAYYPNGSPRLFVGTFRPPRAEIEQAAGFIPTYHKRSFEESIARGEYDRPLYARDPDEDA